MASRQDVTLDETKWHDVLVNRKFTERAGKIDAFGQEIPETVKERTYEEFLEKFGITLSDTSVKANSEKFLTQILNALVP